MHVSLHAGLIERKRPSTVVDGFAPVQKVPVLDPAASAPAATQPAQIFGRRQSSFGQVGREQPAAALPKKRYGLTLRVDEEMRRRVTSLTEKTDRTLQSVLHEALSGYLDRIAATGDKP